jgi:hypothetical protein
LFEFLRIAYEARDVLVRFASPCQAYIWILELVDALNPKLYQKLEPRLDPWYPIPKPQPDPDPTSWTYISTLMDAAFGGSLYAMAEKFPEPNEKLKKLAEDEEDEKLMSKGMSAALNRVREAIHSSNNELNNLERLLSEYEDTNR